MQALVVGLAAVALLAAAEPKRYTCPRATAEPRIDGKLDDAAWPSAPWTDLFIDIEGNGKPAPRYRTRAKMLWDDRYFYIGAEMEEPDLWATYRKHDSVIFHENDFEVFLDPDGDGLNYFEFEINALNTGWDLFLPKRYKHQGKADNSWSIPGLRTAVHMDGTLNRPADRDRGWSVEMAFPWSAFNRGPRPAVAPKPGETWRVNFSRVEWKLDVRGGKYVKPAGIKEDNWVWSPQGVIDMHQPETWGYVTFAEKAN
ncbi:MAG: carbohydrate-binding family 9-like protein [Bryobacteraceae bacterium]